MKCASDILSPAACPTLQYFSTLAHKWQDFRKKKKSYWTQKTRVLIFSTTFIWNISHSKKNWARCDKKVYNGLQIKYQLFLSYFNKTRIFSTNFRKKIFKYQISWKSVEWEPCCSTRTDRRTDRHDEAKKKSLFELSRTRLKITYFRLATVICIHN